MITYRCEICDKEFKAYPQSHGADRRFCSRACYQKWRHKHRRMSTCGNCGKTFTRFQTNSGKFCSRACFQEWRHKHTEKARIRICKNCGREFLKRTNNKGIFCSFACFIKWIKAHKILRMRICEICGKEFEWKKFEYNTKRGHHKGRFCSRKCFLKYWIKPKKMIDCPKCGTQFRQTQYHKKYCSRECYSAGRSKSGKSRQEVCRELLKKHHDDMKGDPERLTTNFMANLVGCSCPKTGAS